MFATEESLRIFQGPCKYIIPEISIPYAYNKNYLENLWNKLTSNNDKVILEIVCFKEDEKTFDKTILDGQDKIITLSLLIKSLLSGYINCENESYNILKEIIFSKSFILDENTLIEKIGTRIEILNSDREAFENIIYDIIDKTNTSPIASAYSYFQNKIKITTPNEIDNIIKKITDNQFNLLFVFNLLCDDDKNSYLNVINSFN